MQNNAVMQANASGGVLLYPFRIKDSYNLNKQEYSCQKKTNQEKFWAEESGLDHAWPWLYLLQHGNP